MHYLRTEDVPVGDLTPYPGNARRGSVPVITESLHENGQYRSLVVREKNGHLIILAGNHTYEAITLGGHLAARCEIIECDDAEARRIHTVDNRSNDIATWDDAALYRQLQEFDGNYAGTGWDEESVAVFMAGPHGDEDDQPPPGPPPPPQFGVVVVCASRAIQDQLIIKFGEDGYTVRPLTPLQ